MGSFTLTSRGRGWGLALPGIIVTIILAPPHPTSYRHHYHHEGPPNRGPTHATSKLTLNVHAITPREAGRAKRNRKKAKAKTCTPRFSAVVVSLVRFHLKCILCSVGFASGFFSCFDLWMFWHEEAGKREFFLGEALKRFRRVWRLSLRGQGHL